MKLTFESRPAYAFVSVQGPVDVASEAASLREAAAEQARLTRRCADARSARRGDHGARRTRRDSSLGRRAPHASASALITSTISSCRGQHGRARDGRRACVAFLDSSDPTVAHALARWFQDAVYDARSTRPLPPIDAATRRASAVRHEAERRSDRPAPMPRRIRAPASADDPSPSSERPPRPATSPAPPNR